MRHFDLSSVILRVAVAVVWGLPIVAVVVIVLVNVNPWFGMAADAVITRPAHPGYTASCREDHRIVVEYPNPNRAYVHCEPAP